jgi:hypothetical protein
MRIPERNEKGLEVLFQCIISPVLIIIIGKYIDNKAERYRKKRAEEKAQELAKEQEMAAKIEFMQAKIECMQDGLMSILRDRILQSCGHYIDKGAIDPLALENINRMHDSYKALGGNGLCDHQYEAIKNLPLEE